MLLLQTFAMIKDYLFRVEFKRRLPKALATILKPKTIEDCPGLNNYATELLIHIQSQCLHYMAHDFIKTCSGLIKPATRIHETRDNRLTATTVDPLKDSAMQYEAAEDKAIIFPNILRAALKQWLKMKKKADAV